jgi:hypothetical protein
VSLVCPSCGGATVQRQKIVHEGGTATVTATTIGFGRGLFAAGTSGRQQTELARRVAPPHRAPTGFALALASFGILFAATGWPLFGGSLAAISGLATAEFVRQNKVLYPARLARYDRTWICLSCGHEWVTDAELASGQARQ